MPDEFKNQIVTGDARELAKRIPDKSVDLAFADPPYWVGYDYGEKTDKEMEFINPQWLVEELCRIAHLVLVTPGIANLYDYPQPNWVLGWFKPASNGRSLLAGFNVWEPVLVYGKQKKRIWQDAISLHAIQHRAGNGQYFHNCPKPMKLLEWLIDSFSNMDDNVLDPVCGSGTTPVVCKMLGRNYIAFEIDPITADKARERVQNTQPPLFVLEPEQMELAL